MLLSDYGWDFACAADLLLSLPAFGADRAARLENFKFSKDPQFIGKVRDIVGLYLNPPDHAMVLCVDEKSQVQALNRTEPILPLAPGVPAQTVA